MKEMESNVSGLRTSPGVQRLEAHFRQLKSVCCLNLRLPIKTCKITSLQTCGV